MTAARLSDSDHSVVAAYPELPGTGDLLGVAAVNWFSNRASSMHLGGELAEAQEGRHRHTGSNLIYTSGLIAIRNQNRRTALTPGRSSSYVPAPRSGSYIIMAWFSVMNWSSTRSPSGVRTRRRSVLCRL